MPVAWSNMMPRPRRAAGWISTPKSCETRLWKNSAIQLRPPIPQPVGDAMCPSARESLCSRGKPPGRNGRQDRARTRLRDRRARQRRWTGSAASASSKVSRVRSGETSSLPSLVARWKQSASSSLNAAIPNGGRNQPGPVRVSAMASALRASSAPGRRMRFFSRVLAMMVPMGRCFYHKWL